MILKDVLAEIVNSGDGAKKIPAETVGSADGPSVVEIADLATKIAKRAPSLQEKLQNAWLQVQATINTIYDSDLDKIRKKTVHLIRKLFKL